MRRCLLLLILSALNRVVHSFSPVSSFHNAISLTTHFIYNIELYQTKGSDTLANKESDLDSSIPSTTLSVPLTFKDMITATSDAVMAASSQGLTRQTVRILLPRDPTSRNIGTYFEDDVDVESRTDTWLLAPPDESWQGGIMQLYRAAAPSAQAFLRKIGGTVAGVPPKLVEDRSIDDSGVDGVGLWMSQSNNPKEDISCFVQPLQETVDAIETISQQAGERLVILMNPQWRSVDDALDSASKNEGFLGSLASFLGGKGESLKRLEEAGFKEVFTIEGYVCKGGNIRLMKRFDSNWVVFAENDSETGYILIGDQNSRPSYQDVEKMLDDKGISLKYARDIGLAPKLE